MKFIATPMQRLGKTLQTPEESPKSLGNALQTPGKGLQTLGKGLQTPEKALQTLRQALQTAEESPKSPFASQPFVGRQPLDFAKI